MADEDSHSEWWRLRSLPADSDPPPGAIRADRSKQASNNSYGEVNFYVDLPFECEDCGSNEIWTAEQQQWWFEEAKGNINSIAVRFRSCRKRRREERNDRNRN